MSPRASGTVDAVVVGGGLAGLSAARTMVDAGRSVIVVEARDRVGGRTLNGVIGDGVFDMGGQFVNPRLHKNVVRLCDEFRLELVPMYKEGHHVLDLIGDVSRFSLPLPMPPLWRPFPLANMIALGALLAQIELHRFSVPLDRPWLTPDAQRWESHTLDSYQRRLPSTKASRALMGTIVRPGWGVEAGEFSMLNMLFYTQSFGGLLNSIKALNYRFASGSQEMSLRLAELLGDRVVLGAPVRAIRQDDEVVEVSTEAGSFQARHAVVTVPVPLSSHIQYEPRLTGLREGLAHRMPMGSDVKVFATYRRPFWRDRGLSGWALADRGPLSVAYDNTTPSGQAALLGLIGGKHGHEWGEHDPERRRLSVLEQLAAYFGDEALEPTDYREKDWRDDEWSRGCPSAYMSPGGWLSFGEALRRPFGRIHWAGSELAPVWCTWMDGAISSGEHTAREVLGVLDHGAGPASVAASPRHPATPTPEPEPLPVPVDVAGLVRASVVLFVIMAGLLTLADRVWVELGILAYPGVPPGEQARWVPLLLGSAGVIFVHLHRLMARRFLAAGRSPTGRRAGDDALALALAGSWFFAAHLGSALIGDEFPVPFLLVVVVVWLVRVLSVPRPAPELAFVSAYSALVALLGTVAEGIMAAVDLMEYSDQSLFGMPVWLPALWLQAALLARVVAMRWFDAR